MWFCMNTLHNGWQPTSELQMEAGRPQPTQPPKQRHSSLRPPTRHREYGHIFEKRVRYTRKAHKAAKRQRAKQNDNLNSRNETCLVFFTLLQMLSDPLFFPAGATTFPRNSSPFCFFAFLGSCFFPQTKPKKYHFCWGPIFAAQPSEESTSRQMFMIFACSTCLTFGCSGTSGLMLYRLQQTPGTAVTDVQRGTQERGSRDSSKHKYFCRGGGKEGRGEGGGGSM